jgi:hypothetical protein
VYNAATSSTSLLREVEEGCAKEVLSFLLDYYCFCAAALSSSSARRRNASKEVRCTVHSGIKERSIDEAGEKSFGENARRTGSVQSLMSVSRARVNLPACVLETRSAPAW